MLNISESKRFRGLCPLGSLQESAYGLSIGDVIDDVTTLYDVIIMTSQYSKLSVQKLEHGSTVCVDPLSKHYRRTLC